MRALLIVCALGLVTSARAQVNIEMYRGRPGVAGKVNVQTGGATGNSEFYDGGATAVSCLCTVLRNDEAFATSVGSGFMWEYEKVDVPPTRGIPPTPASSVTSRSRPPSSARSLRRPHCGTASTATPQVRSRRTTCASAPVWACTSEVQSSRRTKVTFRLTR